MRGMVFRDSVIGSTEGVFVPIQSPPIYINPITPISANEELASGVYLDLMKLRRIFQNRNLGIFFDSICAIEINEAAIRFIPIEKINNENKAV
jgi:hypothetical protein